MKTRWRFLITATAIITSIMNVAMIVFMHNKQATISSEQNTSVTVVLRSSQKNSLSKSNLIQWADLHRFFPELDDVSIDELEPVVGIPVADREKDYTTATLTSLFSKMDKEYRDDILFLVMLASEKPSVSDFISNKNSTIQKNFAKEIEDGILQVFAVPQSWYKIDMDIPATFNDSSQRMYWRTKQNIDYIYLMTYASSLGDYYIQLEDDVTAADCYT
ncbi:unnamed protein product [Heligmosomoides polygyrus]|uniref:Lipoprotein n=1 Tax=Heligmosomoides polygyrus TaxID=6339 RepID=A0A183GCG7_HELPZ|nr:unnamed protein product [Heligmosomoides polygyrus]